MSERLPGIKSDRLDEDQQIMEFAVFMSLTAGWPVLRIPAPCPKTRPVQSSRPGEAQRKDGGTHSIDRSDKHPVQ